MKRTPLAYLAALLACVPFSHAEDRILVKEDFDGDSLLTPGAVMKNNEPANDGAGGKSLTGSAAAFFPASSCFDYRKGTVEFKIKLIAESKSVNLDNWAIFRVRAPIPGVSESYTNSFNIINGWGCGLFLLVGDENGKRTVIKYPQIADWKPGEWHHVAATWLLDNPGRSQIALFVDGKLVGLQKDLTIEMDDAAWEAAASVNAPRTAEEIVARSVCFGAVWGKKYDACLDDLRICDYVKFFEERKEFPAP